MCDSQTLPVLLLLYYEDTNKGLTRFLCNFWLTLTELVILGQETLQGLGDEGDIVV